MRLTTKIATLVVSLVCMATMMVPTAEARHGPWYGWKSCGSRYVTARTTGTGTVHAWAAGRHDSDTDKRRAIATAYSGSHNGQIKAFSSGWITSWGGWCRRANYH